MIRAEARPSVIVPVEAKNNDWFFGGDGQIQMIPTGASEPNTNEETTATTTNSTNLVSIEARSKTGVVTIDKDDQTNVLQDWAQHVRYPKRL